MAAASLLAKDVRVQNNGDIRLVNHWGDDDHSGRLEIFIDGHWGTICGKNGTNFKSVAETACRQLGFDVSLLPFYGTVTEQGYPIANNSTKIHFGSINCGSSTSSIFDNYCSTNYHQHVLRCAVDTKVNETACTHRNDIGVSCSSIWIIENPYKGQLFLHGTKNHPRSPNVSLSSGVLGILFEKPNYNIRKPALVCGKDFDESEADTACRQLGYTNANHLNTPLLNQTTNYTIWDTGLNCKSQSHSCLNNCFSKTPTNHTSCKNLVNLSCEFDLSHKNTEASGSPRLCDAAVDDSCKPHVEEHTVTIAIIIVVVVIVAILVACALCITLLVCCLVPGCPIHRKRTGYQSIN